MCTKAEPMYASSPAAPPLGVAAAAARLPAPTWSRWPHCCCSRVRERSGSGRGGGATSRSERAQSLGRGGEGFVLLRDTEPQQRHGRRLGIERRERDGGDLGLADQPVSELEIARTAERAVIDQ